MTCASEVWTGKEEQVLFDSHECNALFMLGGCMCKHCINLFVTIRVALGEFDAMIFLEILKDCNLVGSRRTTERFTLKFARQGQRCTRALVKVSPVGRCHISAPLWDSFTLWLIIGLLIWLLSIVVRGIIGITWGSTTFSRFSTAVAPR